MLYYTCLVVPAVMGVHLLILLGMFDLSVGAVAAAAGVVMAKAVSVGFSLPAAVALGLCVGLLFGFLNWLVVSKLNISALIGTLITMGAARAVSVGTTEGVTLTGLPPTFAHLAQGLTAGIRNAVLIGAALVVMVEFLSHKHIVFRRFYQIGSNRTAAVQSGINVSLLDFTAFALSGMGAAFAGLFQASRTLSASPHEFPDLALDCIAACVIGGDNLSGGSGQAIGAFMGMLMVVVSRNLVILAGINVYWQDLAIAVVLFGAVLLNRFLRANEI
jgi:ribose transport system permease protein